MKDSKLEFNAKLLAWYEANYRKLPWRDISDPYRIWLSEVMLQQTRVTTVIPYFERWLASFPTAESVVQASSEDLLAHWQGLGYYRRCIQFQKGLAYVKKEGIPGSSDQWKKVPGVGEYTAAALASNCFGEVVPSIDGNVLRVVARLSRLSMVGAELHRSVSQWCSVRISSDRPGLWNQAMMELGGTICIPTSPKCSLCPVAMHCRGKDDAHKLPVRIKRAAPIDLRWPVVLYSNGESIGLLVHHQEPWWNGLHVLPRADLPFQGTPIASTVGRVTKHRIYFDVYLVEGPIPEYLRKVKIDELPSVPIPAIYRRAIAMAIEADRSKSS